jgi:hypothetical protein
MDKEKGERDKPFLNTVDGTSIGAVNADIIVSYVVENDTWVGSAERVNEFWDICQRNHHLISSQRLIALKNFHYLEGPIISDTHVN